MIIYIGFLLCVIATAFLDSTGIYYAISLAVLLIGMLLMIIGIIRGDHKL